MAGISSKALKGVNYPGNKKGYNGNELQSKEFADGNGLELYDFNARTYDPRLGRFIQIDPWVELGSKEMLTPYQFSYNNPVRYNDPDGKCPLCLVVEAAVVLWDVYTAYKIGKTAITVVSAIQADAINDFQPVNGINSPVPRDNTAVLKNIPAEISPKKAPAGLPFPIEGNMKMANQKKGPKDLIQEARDAQAREAAAKEREIKRENATKEGKSKIGNSNQDVRGSHDKGASKAKKNDHEAADTRRAREQKAADEKKN